MTRVKDHWTKEESLTQDIWEKKHKRILLIVHSINNSEIEGLRPHAKHARPRDALMYS